MTVRSVVEEEGVATRTCHDTRGKRGSNNKWRSKRWSWHQSQGKERIVVNYVATAGTTVAIAGRTTLNSLITRVIFKEIALSNSGATMRTPLIEAI